MMNLLKFIDARLGEPSTYASIAGLLMMVNVNVDPGVVHAVTLWGGVLAGVLGIVLAEVGAGKSVGQIGIDGLNALVAALKTMPPATTALVLLCGGCLWRLAATIAPRMTIVVLLLFATLGLSACAPGVPTPAQVTTDLTGALTAVSTIEGLIDAATPNALGSNKTRIDAALAEAQTELANLSTTTPASTGALSVQVIDGDLNIAVGILAAVSADVPGLSTFSTEIDAVDALLPPTEAFVNQYLPAPITSERRAHSTRYTLAQARVMLRIRVMR